MIDLHTHTLFSDGVLLPCEMVRRAETKGYRVIGLTDHVDNSNIEFVITNLVRACRDIDKNWKIKVIPGVEITHMPLACLKNAVRFARSKGARLVIVHGESPIECVIPGTNKTAILAGADILAHPGLISIEEAKLAASRDVYLEITARSGHSLANGHVARVAKTAGAKLVIDTDSHDPKELISKDFAEKVLFGAGLDKQEVKEVFKNSEALACRLLDIKKLVR
jgi:histidinol phosphatase-like PHP family hydrolase